MNKKIVKICIFDKHSTPSQILEGNGDYILDNICIEAKTEEGLDGNYVLDATFIIDNEGLYNQISEEAILKVRLDYGDEIFVISKINKGTRYIDIFARQITIDETLNMWIEDIRPTNTSGLSALNTLKNNSIGKKDIIVHSDISNVATAYYMDMNMYKALHDCEQSFINRWGGEVQRRGYNLTINKRIGADRGVQIRSRKNLSGFEANTNIDNVVTRIKAKGFDGIKAEVFVDSPYISKYRNIKTREIKYEDVKVKDENNPDEGYNTLKEAQAELVRLAKLEFSERNIDELRAEYRINFVDLEQAEEYKNYAQAERVYIGDTVNVYEEKHDINISVRAISRKYDVLRQRVIEIELSNYDIKQKSITTSDILAELGSVIEQTKNNNVQEIIQSMINAGIKDSYVIPRQNEVIVADNKDIDKAMNVIRLNKNGLAFSQTGYYGTYEYGFTIDGIINASLIRSGILSGIIVESRGEGSERVVMTQKGLDFYSDTNVAGNIFYDSNGEGTVESAKDRFLIESLNGYVLKLKSSGDVSIEAGEGKKIFLTSDTKVGGSLSCDSISTLYSTCYGDFHVAPNMFGGESAFKSNSVTGDASVAGNMWATEFRQLTTSVNLPFMFNISSKPNCFDILNSFETKVINNNLVLDATYEDEVEEYLNPCLNKDENGNVSIGINSVIANLTDCIKELKKEIDTLKNSSI